MRVTEAPTLTLIVLGVLLLSVLGVAVWPNRSSSPALDPMIAAQKELIEALTRKAEAFEKLNEALSNKADAYERLNNSLTDSLAILQSRTEAAEQRARNCGTLLWFRPI